MAWAPLLISGLGALGGLFGNRGNQTTQNTRQQSNFVNGQSSTSNLWNSFVNQGQTHTSLDPRASEGYNTIAARYQELLGQDPDLKGYTANQLSNMNRQNDLNVENIKGTLASRGITGPATETAVLGQNNNNFASKVQLQNQIPLLARQMQEQLLGEAGSFYHSLPTDTYTNQSGTQETQGLNQGMNWGESSGTGQNVQQNPGNQLGGLFGSMGDILAFLLGNGAFGGGNQQSTQNFGGPRTT